MALPGGKKCGHTQLLPPISHRALASHRFLRLGSFKSALVHASTAELGVGVPLVLGCVIILCRSIGRNAVLCRVGLAKFHTVPVGVLRAHMLVEQLLVDRKESVIRGGFSVLRW